MTPEERAKALCGGAPWVMEKLSHPFQEDFIKQLAACIRAAVAEEREACAQIVDFYDPRSGAPNTSFEEDIAAAIRMRGEP